MSKYLQESTNPSLDRFKIWLSQSDFDIKAAQISFENRLYEWVCYQSIQSVEKCFKAIIVHAGYRPPKTHKLGILISMSNKANKFFQYVKLSKFRKIEAYTFISRYPFVIPGQNVTPHELIDREDAETCLQIATDIHQKVTEFLSTQKAEKDQALTVNDYYFTETEIKSRIEDIKNDLLGCEKLAIAKIILFGSFAREKSRPKTSTMDILVVADTDLSFIERIQYARQVTKGTEPIIEPLVYTPSEFEYMLKEEGEGYLESAIEEGIVVFEKK
jgi:HEPN domain-containing protein/predicted nucleotidyltransferase